MARFASVEEYLDSFPGEVRDVLAQLRRRIHEAVPGGEDAIAYDIATLKVGGRSVVHYAGWKKHVSVYPEPGPSAQDPGLAEEVAAYSTGKGTLRFDLDQPVPYDLVARVAAALARQHGVA